MKGHIWETLNYFFLRGSFYGMILGAYLGTAFYPLLGTILGAMFGIMAGMAAGVLGGIIASVIQGLFFHNDIDLEQYSRRLSRLMGVVVGIGTVAMVWVSIAPSIFELGGWENSYASFILKVMLTSALPIFLLASLSSAYTAYRYPATIIQRITKRGQLVVPEEAMRPLPNEINETFNRLTQHQPPRWLCLSAGVISFIIGSIAVLRGWPITLDDLPIIFLAGPFGALAIVLAWAYCAFGNAMVLTFLKRAVYPASFSAHWHRVSLTGISFVLTWAMIWWTAILAPVIAAAMAHTVYHTLALPDETPDKAKRKEKNALALEEDIEDEDEDADELIDEERLMTERERR
jgi:hypothetical protein